METPVYNENEIDYTQQADVESTEAEPSAPAENFENEQYSQPEVLAAFVENTQAESPEPIINLESELRVIAVEDAASFTAEEVIETAQSDEPVCEIEQIHQANSEFIHVEPSVSAAVYEGVFDGADLEYIITATGIQESIVLHEQREQYTYFFDMDFDGLMPVPQEDGSIFLFDPENNELTAVLEAPRMADANGETSDAVTMELGMLEGQFVMTVTADADWVNAEDRAWPVAVTQATSFNPSGWISITYGPNGHFIGRNGNIISWAHLQFTLPTLPLGATATGAHIQAVFSNASDSRVSLLLHRGVINPLIRRDQFANQGLGAARYPGNLNVGVRINVSGLVRSWYSGVAPSHAAITLQAWESLGSRGRVTINSASSIVVSYINNVGLQDHWSYETIDLGRSGQVHINHKNGLMTFVHPTMQLSGNRMPFGFDHVFASQRSSASLATQMSGNSATLMSFMEYVVPVGSLSMRLTDGTGAAHYFIHQNGDIFVHEHDPSLILERVDWENVTITDGRGTVRRFVNRRLHEIEDANGNVTTINFGDDGFVMFDENGNIGLKQ